MNDQSLTSRIESKIDKGTTSELSLGKNGSLAYANLNEIMEVAKVVAISQVAIPQHLRDNVGACLAVCIQASEWQMSPFSVANKSYVVNNRLAYEAQLVNAVILRRAPIVGRFKIAYSGEGGKRRCKVSVKLDDGEVVDYESPEIDKIPVKNSPLWKGDPDQQLFYYSSRALCRRHFPDVLLGIYTQDEMAEETMREVTPSGPPRFTSEPEQPKLPPTREEQMKPHTPTPEQEQRRAEGMMGTPRSEPVVTDPPETPAVGTPGQQEGGGDPSDADRQTLLADLGKRQDRDGVSDKTIKAWLLKQELIPSTAIMKKDFSIDVLQALDERWDEISGQ